MSEYKVIVNQHGNNCTCIDNVGTINISNNMSGGSHIKGKKMLNKENDLKKEQEEIEKKLRKKQNASFRKLKKMVQTKKEVDEFVKKLKEQEHE